MKQLNFRKLNKSKVVFGGTLLKSGTHPKTARPLDSKLPIHLVLRASRSSMREPRNYKKVNDLVTTVARKNGVRVYDFANVGNHLHLILKLPRRAAWSAFIRELTGRIAHLTRVPWLHRPFTRVISGWRKALQLVKDYVTLNRREAEHGLTRAEGRSMLQIERLLTASRRPSLA